MKIARLIVDGEFVHAQKIGDKFFLIDGNIFKNFTVTKKEVVGTLTYPVEPTKIVALGANYPKHITELNRNVLMQKVVEEKKEPLLFLKPNSSLVASGCDIVLPNDKDMIHFEGELVIVIGKKCKDVSKSDALSYVFGYTIANDVSDRTLQNLDVQWARAKGFDTFCPLGDIIETEIDGQNVQITTTVNGVVRQNGNTCEMINQIDETISFISHIMTLNEGDIILTGTPQGVGQIVQGDCVEIEIDGIGKLSNCVSLKKITL